MTCDECAIADARYAAALVLIEDLMGAVEGLHKETQQGPNRTAWLHRQRDRVADAKAKGDLA